MNLSPSALWQGASSFFRAATSEQPTPEPFQEPASEPEIVAENAKAPIAPKPASETNSKKNDPLAIAAKRILLKKCQPETIAALKKGQNIRIGETFDVYFDLKLQGYGEDWEKRQKPNADAGERWRESTLPGMKVGKKIWVDLQRNKRFRDVREDDVVECITVVQAIPKLHGKSPELTPSKGYRDLVNRVLTLELLRMNAAELELKKKGVTDPVEIEMARREAAILPLRSETFFKHVRAVNRVAKMLLGFGIIL